MAASSPPSTPASTGLAPPVVGGAFVGGAFVGGAFVGGAFGAVTAERPGRTPAPRDERGSSSSALVLLAVLALIVMAGLVTDGAQLSSARQHAQTAAQQAARSAADAGATDRIVGRSDPYRARAAAQDHLARAGVDGEVTIRPDGTVLVRTRVVVPTQLLSIIGIGELTGHGEAVADLRQRTG